MGAETPTVVAMQTLALVVSSLFYSNLARPILTKGPPGPFAAAALLRTLSIILLTAAASLFACLL